MSDLLDKKAYYSVLFEYYRPLFTNKQATIFDFYYNEDYSLSEIGEELSISRNAVWDTINNVLISLDKYEEKLKLRSKEIKLNEYLEMIYEHADDFGKEIISKIQEME